MTPGSYWTRVGVRAVERPPVWGPVHGGVDPLIGPLPALGTRGILRALATMAGRPAADAVACEEEQAGGGRHLGPELGIRGGGFEEVA
jgi:hypothetical protein